MKVDFFVKREFPVAGAFAGVAELKNLLLNHFAVVIMEDDQYFGVLTAMDVMRKSHVLAIDCLCAKSPIAANQSINNILALMKYENTEVLPVFEDNKIVGLVFQRDIIDYLSNHNEELQKEIDLQTKKIIEQNTELKEKIFQQRLELETIIEQRTKELLDLVETKDKFIRIVATELRNPFGSILGLLKLLQQNIRVYDIDKIEKFLTQIYHSTSVTFELLVDLLEWLNANNKDFPFSPEKICIHQLLSDEIITTSFVAAQKNIAIRINVPESICAYVDKNRVKTIFRNLINNAVKFTAEKGEIAINAVELGDFVEISVTDSGIGVSTEIIGKVLSDGLRAFKETDSEIGTGIGLLLCKEFIEVEGGRIWIESSLGQGSVFKFTLPKFQPEQADDKLKRIHSKSEEKKITKPTA
jgi:signal transduction histidine kinase